MSQVTKAATRTFPGSNGRVAVTGSLQTVDLSAYKGQYVGIEVAGTTAVIRAYSTSALAGADSTLSATEGANKGFDLADGEVEEFYVSENKQYLRLLGAAAGNFYVWDLGKK